ncbi:uncharacterized protein FOMMEDRAFT_156878 [Fomitiporia mediterranea MF3/22]|uniref:uncharacterized protein n=1 Tax=Fomitiporia mediterranea (strain MF3/22) TaxID=694068 RepID=UPI000440733C|nr:uncharacterized protein FOMMEDRAFT_156878 [Fomitiporia mediterranea MF3/22]EJD03468.1 hypothetical protein FOMMEDRAFT_156878 [Fomitiporia mediterranea MF3/22]
MHLPAPLFAFPLPLPPDHPLSGYVDFVVIICIRSSHRRTGQVSWAGSLYHLLRTQQNLASTFPYCGAIHKFVFVNYSGKDTLQQFDGKTITLDISDRYAPFSSPFIIHKMCVRGFYSLNPVSLDMPNDPPRQDWDLSDGVLNDDISTDARNFSNETFPPMTTNTGGTSLGRRALALNENVIADILAATHTSPSRKACQMEGTDWSGTATENIQKYVSTFDVQGDDE